MKIDQLLNKYQALLASMFLGAAIWFSSNAAFQISYAQRLFDVVAKCAEDSLVKCNVEYSSSIELQTMLWNGNAKLYLFVSGVFFLLAGTVFFRSSKKVCIQDADITKSSTRTQ